MPEPELKDDALQTQASDIHRLQFRVLLVELDFSKWLQHKLAIIKV